MSAIFLPTFGQRAWRELQFPPSTLTGTFNRTLARFALPCDVTTYSNFKLYTWIIYNWLWDLNWRPHWIGDLTTRAVLIGATVLLNCYLPIWGISQKSEIMGFFKKTTQMRYLYLSIRRRNEQKLTRKYQISKSVRIIMPVCVYFKHRRKMIKKTDSSTDQQ